MGFKSIQSTAENSLISNMIDYVASLLPRIQQYSKGLNDTAIFADIPWGFIDDDGDKVTYIFRRNNELLVSKKGDVTTGRWEYLPVMQSLLIEHGNHKRMYNQGFVDNVVMALRKDGTEELFLLANQQAIPDMDAVEYLEQKVQRITTIGNISVTPEPSIKRTEVMLKNSRRVILIEANGYIYQADNVVFDKGSGNLLENGTFETNDGYLIEIENGKIKNAHDRDNIMVVIILVVVVLLLFLFATLYSF